MALPPFMYEPLVSPRLFGALDPTESLMGGGPAYMTITPDFMPEPAEGPAPAAMTPQEEFLARVQQVEQMVPGVLPTALPPAAAAPAAPATPAGFQFMTDRGRQAGYGRGNTGFLTADPNTQYRMWDERGKNRVVAEGAGMDALQNIYNLANQFNKEQGKKANWGIERLNPATGQWERVAENDPAKNIAGKIADVALPVLGAVVAGPLGAAAGSGLSSVAQGRSLEDTLLRAAISGGASFAGGQLLGSGVPVPSEVAGEVASQTAGQLAGQAAGQAAGEAALSEILVQGARQAAASGLGSAIGSGAGSLLGSAIGSAPAPTAPEPVQQPAQSAPTNEIVVTAPATASGAPASNYVLGTLLPAIGAASVPSAPSVSSTATQPQPAEKNSLLDDIIKYYSLGSAGLELLGGALGAGGGGTAAPHTSRLGAMPTFTRGAFTPFAGDYETYGFGPEFNFFGGAPTPTPTAPDMSILPPAAQPGPRLA